MKWDLLVIAALATGFGAYALSLGYDSVVVGTIFGFLGTIAGYIYGKKTEEESEEES